MSEHDLIDIAKKSARSTVWLTMGQGISSIIGGVLTIIIARLLQSTLYGLYAISLVPINIGLLIGNWGVSSAVTKYISQDYPDELSNASKWVSTGFIFEVLNGLFVSIMIFALSDQIGRYFLGKPEAGPLIKNIAFMVLFYNLFIISYGVLNGLYSTKFIALSQVTGAVARFIITIYLLMTGWGVLGALLGFLSYYIVSGLTGAIYAIKTAILHRINLSEISASHLKKLLKYGTPITVNAFFQVVGINIFNAIASHYSTLSDLGNYFAANAILVILAVVNMPITQALIPSFSKVSTGNSVKQINTVLQTAVFLTSLILTPLVFMVMGLSKPIILAIYGSGYKDAPLYLKLVTLTLIPQIFGVIPISSFFLGKGDTENIFLAGSSAFIISLITAMILIPSYGIVGLISTLITFNAIIWIVYQIILKKRYKLAIKFSKILKVFIVSLFMLLILRVYEVVAYEYLKNLFITIAIFSIVNPEITLNLAIAVIGVMIGSITYIVIIGLFRVLEAEDISLIEDVSKSLGPLQVILKYFIMIINKISRLRR